MATRFAAALLFVVLLGGDALVAQPGNEPEPAILMPRGETRCEPEKGQVDRYRLILDANQTLDVTVEQRGVDAVARLRDPEGDLLLSMDGKTGAVGSERLVWIVEESGHHELEIESMALDEPKGCYEVRYEVSETVDAADRQRVAALRSLARARDPDLLRSEAIRRHQEALARWESLGDLSWQAETLNGLGLLYYDDDQPAEALRHFKAAADRAESDSVQRAHALTWLGECYEEAGDLEQAREHLASALALWGQRFGANRWQASAAAHLGWVLTLMGEYNEAQHHFDEAVGKWRRLGSAQRLATALGNRGWIHYYFSRLDLAYEDLSEALEIEQRLGLPNQAVTLTNLSYIRTARDDYQGAIALLREADRLRGSDRGGRAVTQAALGWTHHQAGNLEEALRNYREAAAVLRELGDTHSLATVERKLGRLRQEKGEDEQALRHFEEAFSLAASERSLDAQAEALLGTARSLHALGRSGQALEKVDRALELVEELRKQPVNPRSRALVFASKQHFFEFKIRLLMELHERHPDRGWDAAALEVNEQARARSLMETLKESGVDLRAGADEGLLDREERLLRKIKSKLHQSLSEPEPTRETRLELGQLQRQYDLTRAEIRASHPHFSALTEVAPLDVDAIRQEVLDEDTILLEYFLGREECFLWAVTLDSLDSFKLKVDPEEIDSVARTVYKMLPESEKRIYRVQLEADMAWLSELLLAPVAALLPGKRLLIVSSGALQYVPFAALPIPGKTADTPFASRLVSEHEIVHLPSASTLGVLRDVDRREREKGRRPSLRTAKVFADPVFEPGDDRLPGAGAVTRSIGSAPYKRLEYSLREAEAIRRLLPDADVATGFEANKKSATDPDLGTYRYVHFATHGTFDSQFPERSRILLSRFDPEGKPLEDGDGALSLPETYQLNLAAELVVLSACQTALGEEIRGEGLVGLTQGFMYSGTPRVLASLWNVQDESTALLMRFFYRHLVGDGHSPAAALRAAQLDFVDRYPGWNAPYYWAGFVLHGDF